MTTAALVLGFACGFFGSVPLAGPISLLVSKRGLQARYEEGLLVAVGAAAAEACYCGLAVYGVDLLWMRFAALERYLELVGAAAFAVLGAAFAFSRHDLEGVVEEGGRPASGRLRTAAAGFAITILNPTLIMTWSAGIAGLYSVLGVRLGGFAKIAFVLGVAAGIVLWFATLLEVLRHYRQAIPRRLFAWGLRAVGALLIGIGGYGGWRAWR